MTRRLTASNEISSTIRAVIGACPEREWTPKPIKAEALDQWASDKGSSANIYGYFSEGKPKGFLLGVIVIDPTTGEKTASELCWWVVPAFRGTGAATELLNAFEADARKEGATEMFAGFSTHVNGMKMVQLYNHLGFKPHLVTVRKKL